MFNPHLAQVVIRPAYADDYQALAHLAELDSAPAVPPRPLLIAEVDGELRAALSLRDGSRIAHPFFPTAGLIVLLEAHSSHDGALDTPVFSRARQRRGRRRLRPRPAHG
jgi:hypothetical protein